MEQIEKSRISLIIYIVIVIAITAGGWFLITRNTKEEKKKNSNDDYAKIKLDQDQDYVYYSDSEVISSHLKVIYKNINININSDDAKQVETTINQRVPELKEQIKYISEQEIDKENPPIYYEDNIYSAPLQTYKYYQVKNKLVIIVDEYTFDCYGIGGAHTITSYHFNLKNGNLLTKENLLEEYQITEDTILEQITNYVQKLKNQTTTEESELIKDTTTINNIKKGNYTIYINEKNELVVNFVVFTNEIDYNENIIIN